MEHNRAYHVLSIEYIGGAFDLREYRTISELHKDLISIYVDHELFVGDIFKEAYQYDDYVPFMNMYIEMDSEKLLAVGILSIEISTEVDNS